MPCYVHKADRVTVAVGKHIIAKQTLSSRYKCIRIDESTQCGVIITGLEVIEPELVIVDEARGLKSAHFDA